MEKKKMKKLLPTITDKNTVWPLEQQKQTFFSSSSFLVLFYFIFYSSNKN